MAESAVQYNTVQVYADISYLILFHFGYLPKFGIIFELLTQNINIL